MIRAGRAKEYSKGNDNLAVKFFNEGSFKRVADVYPTGKESNVDEAFLLTQTNNLPWITEGAAIKYTSNDFYNRATKEGDIFAYHSFYYLRTENGFNLLSGIHFS